MRAVGWLLVPALALAACGDDEGGGGDDTPDAADVGDDAGTDAPGGWGDPACTTVTGGPGAVTFTRDEGETLAPTTPMLQPTRYTFGLVALTTPGTLVAASGNEILRSTDAGCTWAVIGEVVGGTPVLELAGDGETVYGYVDNYPILIVVRGDEVTTLPEAPGGGGVVGMGPDPADADHLRIVTSDGQIHDSDNGGESWTRLGTAPGGKLTIVYRAVFHTTDLDRVSVGMTSDGAMWTDDAGTNWHSPTGLPEGDINGFNLAVSPADPEVVYLEGLLVDEIRHIWRSTDGGESYGAAIVDESKAVQLYNGNPLIPHPTDPEVLYFTFGTYFQGYGTDLYRWEAGTDPAVTLTHSDYHDITAITFAPDDPELMYLGVSMEAPF